MLEDLLPDLFIGIHAAIVPPYFQKLAELVADCDPITAMVIETVLYGVEHVLRIPVPDAIRTNLLDTTTTQIENDDFSLESKIKKVQEIVPGKDRETIKRALEAFNFDINRYDLKFMNILSELN